MRITRIRNDKELGLAKREVDILKEETSGLETELIEVMRAGRGGDGRSCRARERARTLVEPRARAEAVALRDTIARLAPDIERDRGRRAPS